MAIAYAHFTIYSRSRGQSAVAAAAYRAAVRLIDHRTNEVHDYRKREGHVYSEICLPDGAEYLWNQVEKSENRRNSQVAKNLLLALPKEIDHKQQIHLVKDFSNMYFISKGVPIDISIYDKKMATHLPMFF